MKAQTSLFKTTALAISVSLFASTALPISAANAHDRHNSQKHAEDAYNWNKKLHRQFHKTYGRGEQGVFNYRQQLQLQQQRQQQLEQQRLQQQRAALKRKKRKQRKRDIIAAGVIGLAIGAIIASQASKNKNAPVYNSYTPPTPQPSYSYGDPYQLHSDPVLLEPDTNSYGSIEPIPLDEYNANSSNSGGPNIITFDEHASLEPWTPGWREWCENRYRSFNPPTGTYRGYDGLDHFCVPK